MLCNTHLSFFCTNIDSDFTSVFLELYLLVTFISHPMNVDLYFCIRLCLNMTLSVYVHCTRGIKKIFLITEEAYDDVGDNLQLGVS